MAAPYPLRKLKSGLKLKLAKILMGDKATTPHFAWAGAGSSERLCARIEQSGHKNVLVVTDKPLRALGVVDRALEGFDRSVTTLHFYDGVEPDPTFGQVAEGAKVCRDSYCTAVLAVGGGSSIDAAKVIALEAVNEGDPMSWVGLNKAPATAVPIYAIPTTSGTGSEATMGAVITHEVDHSKQIISGLAVLPRAVAVDPDLMLGLPPAITAATGLDALTHGIEAYTSLWERGSRTETSLMAIQGVFKWLPKVLLEPGNVVAREGMALAAYYGGVAINQVNVGFVHAIAHQLGARYGIPHGMANALVLPHVLKAYGSAAEPKLAELARAIGLSNTTGAGFINAVFELRELAGLPSQHAAIQARDIDAIVEAAIAEGDGYFSPRLFTPDEVKSILLAISVNP